jgi:rod shape-determining protein MreB
MTFFSPQLGIDLGTTYILVYVPGKGVVLREPSVVAVSHENKILAIGDEAKMMIGKTPDDVTAYRPMRDGVVADYYVTEAMLRYYMNKALGKFNIFKPDVMISVPVGVTSAERRAVVEAAVKGGAKSAYVVKEPILAAIGAGITMQEAGGHMIVDIGGGTTDIAVISLGGIVASKSIKIGGNRLQRSIIDYVKREYNLIIGEQMAEDVKIKIGSAIDIPKKDQLIMAVRGRDYVSGLPCSIELRTNDVSRAIEHDLHEVLQAIRDVLRETPPELSADIMDNGIIMSGGSSMLRNLQEFVYRGTGVKAQLAKDALYCVAYGAGEALKHLDVYKKARLSKR